MNVVGNNVSRVNPGLNPKSPPAPKTDMVAGPADKVMLQTPQEAAMNQLDGQLLRLFRSYKSSNSRWEQGVIQREMQGLFDKSTDNLSDGMKGVRSKINHIFTKNERAWNTREANLMDPADSVFERNQRKLDLANATPLTGAVDFRLQDVKKARSLMTLKGVEAKPLAGGLAGSVQNEIDPYVDYLAGSKTKDEIDPYLDYGSNPGTQPKAKPLGSRLDRDLDKYLTTNPTSKNQSKKPGRMFDTSA